MATQPTLLAGATSDLSDAEDPAAVADRHRSLRRRRRVAAGVVGLGVLVGLAVLAPGLRDQRESSPEVPIVGSVIWPFERPRMVLLGSGEADLSDLAALAADLEDRADVDTARLLDADEVTARVGEAQAARLLGDGAGAVTIDLPGGAAAKEAARPIVLSAESAQPAASQGRPGTGWNAQAGDTRSTRSDGAIDGVILPNCETLAHSAARIGVEQARGLVEGVTCDRPVRVVAAGPEANEPWVATARGRRPQPVEAREWTSLCVKVLTVRVDPPSGCADDTGVIDGLSSTSWRRDQPVLAGVAPAGTARVTQDGVALAVDEVAGRAVFAGPIAPRAHNITVQAVDADGDVLRRRAITRAELAQPASSSPANEPGIDPDASWPFTAVTEVAVALPVADATVGEVAADLAAQEAVVDVDRLGREQLEGLFGEVTPPGLPLWSAPDASPTPAVLRVTVTDRQAARTLTGFGRRHAVDRVVTPTCGNLASSAVYHGVDRAGALLVEAGCDEVTMLGAGDDPAWMVAASVSDDGTVCVVEREHRGGERVCGSSPPDDGQVYVSHAVGERGEQSLVYGLGSAAMATVEVALGDRLAATETVPLGKGLTGFALSVGGEGTARVRVQDADGAVMATQQLEVNAHSDSRFSSRPLQPVSEGNGAGSGSGDGAEG